MPEKLAVLVTGAAGFVGRHLVELLAGRDVAVRCLLRRKSLDGVSGVETVRGDLVSGEGLDEAVRGASAVVHLAGITKAFRAGEYYRGNVDGTRNLVEAIMRAGIRLERFVHVSSLAAAGPSPCDGPISEAAEPAPLTNYGRSKLKAEEVVLTSALASRSVIVRPPVVYGPRDTDVFEVFRAANRGLLLRVGKEEQYCSLVYVKDLAAALSAAVCAPGAAGKTYFVASQERVSWTELAAMAARLMGKRLRTVAVPPKVAWLAGWASDLRSRATGRAHIISRDKIREAACRYWLCDGSRARRELALPPATPLEAGVTETLGWYKDSGWLRF